MLDTVVSGAPPPAVAAKNVAAPRSMFVDDAASHASRYQRQLTPPPRCVIAKNEAVY